MAQKDSSKISLHINYLAEAIVKYGKKQGEDISENSANLTVRILLLRPMWHAILTDDATKEIVQDFVEACVKYLLFDCTISSVTIRMQSFFYGNYIRREEFREKYKAIKEKNCHLLLQKIKKSWHNPTENFDRLHDDVVRFILIREGMDDESDASAFIEIKNAVRSIFPPEALSTFVLSNQKTKMKYLKDISSIAVGIRLFMWYQKKSGQYMLNVAKIVKDMLSRATEEMHEEYKKTVNVVEDLQSSFKDNILYNTKSDDLEKEYFHQKMLLVFWTNYKMFIKTIIDDVNALAVRTYKQDYTFNVQLNELQRATKTSPLIQADVHFPLYKIISDLWRTMQMECHLLSFYVAVFNDIKSLVKKALAVDEKSSLLHLDAILMQAANIEEQKLDKEDDPEKPLLISPETVKNYKKISLQYKDYCAWACATGILLESDKELGIIMYKNNCYGFSSDEARENFMEKPEYCIRSATRFMQAIPELVITLQLEDVFHLPVINDNKCKPEFPVFVSSQSTQTVLHPIEPHIDYSYRWNQWDLRRRALKHADLLNRRTSSTQTDLSHFRRENFSQVYLPKENGTQTRIDKGTSMSKPGMPDVVAPPRAGIFLPL